MGNLMKEVRSWLEDTEMFIKILRAEKDPQKESKIQEKIEVRFKIYLVHDEIKVILIYPGNRKVSIKLAHLT